MKELGIANLVGNPTYTPTTLAKEEILDYHRSVLYSLEFQPRMKNCIEHHSTGFLNYTSVLSNRAMLLGLPNAPRNLFPNYYHVFYRRSTPCFRITATLAVGGVNQMWILKNSEDQLEYMQSIQYRSLSSCNSINTFDFSTLYITIPHSKREDKLSELIQLCFIKNNGQRRYKYLVLGRDRSYLKNNSLKLISSTCSSF
jgi:hypothetical protein